MKLRKEKPSPPAEVLLSLAGLSLSLLAAACGAPGEPTPPSPPIPSAISDLAGRQIGDAVLLTFALPLKSTLGERLN